MSSRIATSLAAIALAASASAASAQTTVAPNLDPAKVGVTQPTAINAEQKAVPQSNVGTLVRTDKKRRAVASDSSASSAGVGAMDTTADSTAPAAGVRAARHARN